jgi:predicted nucleic acid-binding protein
VIASFDTSAIVPLIIEEATSDNCRRLWNEATRVASVRLLYPETRAALARAERMGRLTAGQLTNAVDELESLIEQLDIIEVSTEIVRAAGEFAQRFGLRGYDAVHLAAGLAMNDADVVLVTSDHDLATASQAAGIATALTTP